MNRKVTKILTVVLTIAMLVAMATTVFAASNPPFTPGNLEANYEGEGPAKIQDVGQRIMGVLTTVGIVISVVILIILGIKYMMGSASEKAEYKKTMIPYLVGAVFIFGASALANVVYQFAIGLKS